MSTRASITVNNETAYTLNLFQVWGGPYSVNPPETMPPNSTFAFDLADNDRAGVVYLATDSVGNEVGFVTMSYTCPESSDNSAEGSPDMPGIFIPAGLQPYDEHGTPVQFTYNIGQPNLACWDSGSSNNGEIACSQTNLEEWARVIVAVTNPLSADLNLVSNWQEGPWMKPPQTVNANSNKIFLLNDNNRAGINFKLNNNIPINMSFTCPESSDNSAEGSPMAGLATYAEHGTPVFLTYKVGSPNAACWDSGSSNSGEIECAQTNIGDMSSWMQDSMSTIGTKTLNDMCIPGSHDSGMSVSNNGTIGAAPCNTQTQTQSILGQLNLGARYFDIRPIVGSGQYFTGHYSHVNSVLGMQGARGESIPDIISDINNFTATNNELIILNF